MKDELLKEVAELLRETFEGGLPGEGTRYLDHASGIRATLGALDAEQASRSRHGHPSIAAHARHMNFHLRVVAEWMQGVRIKRDWKGSFEPGVVSADEWARLQSELEKSRAEFLRVLESLPPETFASEGAGMDAVVHLAYHLGAIRQLMHDVSPG
jgi:hypothetical protein